MGGFRTTPREAVFSVSIFAALFLVGFLASTKIQHHVNRRNLRYRQAAKIAATNEFAVAMRTDVGDAFVEGDFRAIDTVEHQKLGGRWLSIFADCQKYTRHTRTVTYTVTDANGRVHTKTRTEEYWTWDTYRTERIHSKRVEFMGREFPFDKFSYNVDRRYKTVDDGWHRRIVFTSIPPAFHAAAFTELACDTVKDRTALRGGATIESLYKAYTRTYAVGLFWVLWGAVMAAAVVGFMALENDWLEG